MNAWRWWMRRQVHHGWNTCKGQAPCLCWSMDEETWGGDAPGYGALADEYLAKPADPTLIDGFDFEFSAHPHSLGLAMRMADWLGQWGDKQQVPDFTLLADALEDAFWHAARRLREGLPALYLDQLGVLSMGPDGPSMAFDADLTAKPEPAAAAGAALSGAVLSFESLTDGGVELSTGDGQRLVLRPDQVGAAARCLAAMAEAGKPGPASRTPEPPVRPMPYESVRRAREAGL